jgi:hypothetical protein
VPFRSQAQRRKFYSDPHLRQYAHAWEAETPHDVTLPKYVRTPKRPSPSTVSKRARVPRRGE